MAKLGRGFGLIRQKTPISAEDFQKLESTTGLTFPDPEHARARLEEALSSYVFILDLEKGRFGSRDMINKIQIVERATFSMAKKFRHLQSSQAGFHVIETIFQQLPGSQNGRKEVQKLLEDLDSIYDACKKAKRSIAEEKISTVRRSETQDAKTVLFTLAAAVYEVDGRDAAANWAPVKGKFSGKFLDFVYELLQLAPPEYRPAQNEKSALGDDVRDWSRTRREGQKPLEK